MKDIVSETPSSCFVDSTVTKNDILSSINSIETLISEGRGTEALEQFSGIEHILQLETFQTCSYRSTILSGFDEISRSTLALARNFRSPKP